MVLESGVKLYGELYDWLTCHGCGEYRTMKSFKEYQKNLWNPILKRIDELSQKDELELKEDERRFLNSVLYKGKIYRKIKYNSRNQGHICEIPEYASWSSDIKGVQAVPGLGGDILLIVGYTDRGINIRELLIYFWATKACISFGNSKSISRLERYLDENEIAAPTLLKNIEDIKIIDLKDISEWELKGSSLEKSKWKRNRL